MELLYKGNSFGTTDPTPVGLFFRTPINSSNHDRVRETLIDFCEEFGAIPTEKGFGHTLSVNDLGNKINREYAPIAPANLIHFDASLTEDLCASITLDVTNLYGNTGEEIAPALLANNPTRLDSWTRMRLLEPAAKGAEWDRRFALRNPDFAYENAQRAVAEYGDRLLTVWPTLAKLIDSTLVKLFHTVPDGCILSTEPYGRDLQQQDYALLLSKPEPTGDTLRKRLTPDGLEDLLGISGALRLPRTPTMHQLYDHETANIKS